MISHKDALEMVLASSRSLGTETVDLSDAGGRFLAETITADRDFPPFDRVTMDGIGIAFSGLKSDQTAFLVEDIARAGAPQAILSTTSHCIEVTTGAMLPIGCDTVIPYEHLHKCDNGYQILVQPKEGQNIHLKGSDTQDQSLLLKPGVQISAAEIAILATVGKTQVLVHKSPEVTILSTGDELVPVHVFPEPHQIRTSNNYMLQEALRQWHIRPNLLHLPDDKIVLTESLSKVLAVSDALIISGGVSMGKFDFLPDTLTQLGVKNSFHRVAQKPGKPFWFGTWNQGGCVVFSLPGNPVSTFLNYLVYFEAWLRQCWQLPLVRYEVKITAEQNNSSKLTQFTPVRLIEIGGQRYASPIANNGSGDFISLTHSDGFIVLEPESKYAQDSILPYIPFIS